MLSIKLFNATPWDGEALNPCLLTEYGVLVQDGSQQAQVLAYLQAHRLTKDQMNETSFFRSWTKAATVDIRERLLHQMVHYLTTYGLGMWDSPYLPLDQFVEDAPDGSTIYVIRAMPRKEMIGLALDALKRKTDTTDYVRLLVELGYEFTGEEEVGSLESEVLIADLTGKMPRDIVRYLIYKATGETLKIKSQRMLQQIEQSKYEIPKLSCAEMERAAESFLRDRMLWLAFKRANRNNAPIVNKIRRLAAQHHKPFVDPLIRRLTSAKVSQEELIALARKTKTGDLARAVNAIRIYNATDARVYRIRNGRTHARVGNPPVSVAYLDILMDELRSRIKSYTAPEGIHLALPVSAKKFVGELPEGTAIDLPEGCIVGIYWQGEGVDLDLSATMLDGYYVGWYGNWQEKVVYSGDMTSAPHGASEWLWFKENTTAMININAFRAPKDQEFILTIARRKDKPGSLYNYMVSPDEVIFQERFQITQRQMTIGLAHNWKLYICNAGTGNGMVAVADPTRIAYLIAEAENALRLEDVSVREEGPVNRDQLIKLIS